MADNLLDADHLSPSTRAKRWRLQGLCSNPKPSSETDIHALRLSLDPRKDTCEDDLLDRLCRRLLDLHMSCECAITGHISSDK